eukprot:1852830-Rhodomonas_salina.2
MAYAVSAPRSYAEGATRCAVLRQRTVLPGFKAMVLELQAAVVRMQVTAMCLRAPYVVPRTDLAYGCTRREE